MKGLVMGRMNSHMISDGTSGDGGDEIQDEMVAGRQWYR